MKFFLQGLFFAGASITLFVGALFADAGTKDASVITQGEAVAGNGGATPSVTANADGTSVAVSFETLGNFPFEPPTYDPAKPDDPVAPRVDAQIPSAVRALNGKDISVTGFMLPTHMEGGQVVEFLLLRNQMMCCFGGQPQMNEWIIVRLEKPGAYMPDVPKTFSGTLRVGAVIDNGYMSGVYLLENAKAK